MTHMALPRASSGTRDGKHRLIRHSDVQKVAENRPDICIRIRGYSYGVPSPNKCHRLDILKGLRADSPLPEDVLDLKCR